jgi:hypothetical protein
MRHSLRMTKNHRFHKSASLFLLALFFAASAAAPLPTAHAQSAGNSNHDPHLQALDWLTHGTWTAEVSPPGGKTVLVQNEVRWAETGTALYFLTRFNHQAHYYGVYLYDPAAKQIKFFYSSSDGEMTVGHSDPSENEIKQEFEIADAQGTTPFHSLMKRDGEDVYDFTVYQQGSDKPMLTVHYVRK